MCKYSETVAALKAEYSKHKTYNLRRGEQREVVQQLAKMHGLTENEAQSGYVQCTASISYGWSVHAAGDKAVMIYRDSGMGWDTVMLMGRNNAALEELRQTGIATGLVKLRGKRVAA